MFAYKDNSKKWLVAKVYDGETKGQEIEVNESLISWSTAHDPEALKATKQGERLSFCPSYSEQVQRFVRNTKHTPPFDRDRLYIETSGLKPGEQNFLGLCQGIISNKPNTGTNNPEEGLTFI